MIEASELIAGDVFSIAEQARQRITFGDVERTWPSWPLIPATVAVAAVC